MCRGAPDCKPAGQQKGGQSAVIKIQKTLGSVGGVLALFEKDIPEA